MHYRSVHRWIAWYRRGGLALVCSRQQGGVGQTPFMSTDPDRVRSLAGWDWINNATEQPAQLHAA